MHPCFAILFGSKQHTSKQPPFSFFINPQNDLFPPNFAREIDVDPGPLQRLVSLLAAVKSGWGPGAGQRLRD